MDATGILYTAGYGNAAPARFLASLAEHHLDLALDARLRPWGWHADYRGEQFLRSLVSSGGARKARWSRRLGNAAKAQGGEMRLQDPSAIDDLIAVLRRGLNVVVICGCRDASGCHRRLIGELVQAADSAIEVRHIPPPTPAPTV